MKNRFKNTLFHKMIILKNQKEDTSMLTRRFLRGIMAIVLLTSVMFSNSFSNINAMSKYNFRSIQELDSLKIEDTLTYEEMLEYMRLNSYTYSEIQAFQGKHQLLLKNETVSDTFKIMSSTLSGTEIRYSLVTMSTYSYNYGLWDKCKVQARFSAGLEYDIGASSPNRIVTLAGEHAYTGGGSPCVFSGGIFYRLEAGNRFYYNMYGNLYKQGNVNWTLGGAVGIGQQATLNGSISNGNGFIKNISVTETYISSGLEP